MARASRLPWIFASLSDGTELAYVAVHHRDRRGFSISLRFEYMAWKWLLRTVQRRWTQVKLTDHEFLSKVYRVLDPEHARAGRTWLGVSAAHGRSKKSTNPLRTFPLLREITPRACCRISICFAVGSRTGEGPLHFHGGTETIKQPKVRTAGLYLTVQELDVRKKEGEVWTVCGVAVFSLVDLHRAGNQAFGVQSIIAPDGGYLYKRDPVFAAPSVELQDRHCPVITLTRTLERLGWTRAFTNVTMWHLTWAFSVSRASRPVDLTFCKSCWDHGLRFLPTSHRRSFSFTSTSGSCRRILARNTTNARSRVTLTWMARLTMWPQTWWNWTSHRLWLFSQRRTVWRPQTKVLATRYWRRHRRGRRATGATVNVVFDAFQRSFTLRGRRRQDHRRCVSCSTTSRRGNACLVERWNPGVKGPYRAVWVVSLESQEQTPSRL